MEYKRLTSLIRSIDQIKTMAMGMYQEERETEFRKNYLSIAMQLEQTVAEEFSIQTGLRVYEIKNMFRHEQYPFMLANVDRFIDLPDGTMGILECKTANPNSKSKWEDGGVPFHYECQVHHYMAVMNIDVA